MAALIDIIHTCMFTDNDRIQNNSFNHGIFTYCECALLTRYSMASIQVSFVAEPMQMQVYGLSDNKGFNQEIVKSLVV